MTKPILPSPETAATKSDTSHPTTSRLGAVSMPDAATKGDTPHPTTSRLGAVSMPDAATKGDTPHPTTTAPLISPKQAKQRMQWSMVGILVFASIGGILFWQHQADINRRQKYLAVVMPRSAASGVFKLLPRKATQHVYLPQQEQTLMRLFAYHQSGNHRLQAPRIYTSTLPVEVFKTQTKQPRWLLLQRLLIPIILQENQRLAAERTRLQAILKQRKQGTPLPTGDVRWLRSRQVLYQEKDAQRLPERIAGWPPSLVLAQAALDSQWGARVTRQGKNLFLAWEKLTHGHVQASPRAVVQVHMRWWNTTPQAHMLRKARLAMLLQGAKKQPTNNLEEAWNGFALATYTPQALENSAHAKALKSVFSTQQWQRFDAIQLASKETTPLSR